MSDRRFLNDCLRWSMEGLRYEATKKLVDEIESLESQLEKEREDTKSDKALIKAWEKSSWEVSADRDLWKSKAENLESKANKLAEALRAIVKVPSKAVCCETLLRMIAKEALADFEAKT